MARRRPDDESLPGGDEDLDARAEISPADVEEAKRWLRRADREFFRLLVSGWDERLGRYRMSRTLAPREVRGMLDRALDSGSREARSLSEKLRDRKMGIPDWQLGMERMVKSTQLSGVAAARGGWHQMGPADYARAANAIRRQNRYLHRFADQVRSGVQKRDGSLVRRAEMYPQAARATYHEAERVEMEARGYREEKNIRYAGDSCGGCQSATAAGWAPIGTLPPVGSRDCLGRCRCLIVYRDGKNRVSESLSAVRAAGPAGGGSDDEG